MGRKERRRQQKLVRQGHGSPPDRDGNQRLVAMAAQALGSGNLPEAQALCRRVLDRDPENPDALHLFAVLALRAGNGAAALKHLKAAVKAAPERADIQNNLGNALTSLGRSEEAAAAFARAAEMNPGLAEALYNSGQALRRLERYEEAEQAFLRSLELAPGDAMALNGLGIVLKAMARPDEAEAAFRSAVESRPGHVGAWLNLANLLVLMGHETDAIAAYERVLAIEPENPQALAYIYRPLQSACAWDRLAELDDPLDRATDRALAAGLASIEEPFLNVSRCADPARNLAVARSWAEALARGAGGKHQNRRRRTARQNVLTIGYLSADYFDHPTSHLAGSLYAEHTRPDFRVVGIAANRDDGSVWWRQAKDGCDRFIEIWGMPNDLATQRIRDEGIDILVDLGGHTRKNGLALCARCPAPVQVTWLGYPGTTGAGFIDYLIADQTVLPAEYADFCTEKVVYLPGTYQVNGLQTAADVVPSRRECGLPEAAFVFCTFCQTYKIDRTMFTVWMEILSKVPDSVLWLYGGPESATRNLRHEAATAGIDPSRLVFGGRLPKDRHLARMRNADLGLDTRIYGGHTTTSDLLLAGVPVITLIGNHFASRVGASILKAAGLDDLITDDLNAYRDIAIELAGTPARLNSLRKRLTENPANLSLFDCGRFCNNLETAYRHMWKMHTAGQKPASFAVD
jgi:protein O-GlcNAc transferase